jgi:hypothetical protein
VIAIIFIVDQHVRVLRGRDHFIWRVLDINEPSVGGKKMLNASEITVSGLEIK